jgi:hypothetical protein
LIYIFSVRKKCPFFYIGALTKIGNIAREKKRDSEVHSKQMSNDPVKQYQSLKKKPKSEEALQLLKRLASQVKPILSKHNWTIKNLCEFYPTNPNLLGNSTRISVNLLYTQVFLFVYKVLMSIEVGRSI